MIDFIGLQTESMKVLGFWNETSKSGIIKWIEKAYVKDIIVEWGISDMIIKEDKILLRWYKRILPLSDEQYEKEYQNNPNE